MAFEFLALAQLYASPQEFPGQISRMANTGAAVAGDRRIGDRPVEERRNNQPQQAQHQEGQHRVGDRAEQIAPQPIENKLKNNPLVGQAALVGDKHKFVAALISPNFAALEDWARQNSVAFGSRAGTGF